MIEVPRLMVFDHAINVWLLSISFIVLFCIITKEEDRVTHRKVFPIKSTRCSCIRLKIKVSQIISHDLKKIFKFRNKLAIFYTIRSKGMKVWRKEEKKESEWNFHVFFCFCVFNLDSCYSAVQKKIINSCRWEDEISGRIKPLYSLVLVSNHS